MAIAAAVTAVIGVFIIWVVDELRGTERDRREEDKVDDGDE